jgi:AraC family transcriptional regulator
MPAHAQGDRKPVTPEERLDFLPYGPAASSAPLGWSNLRVEHFQGNPDLELSMPPLTHHLLLVYQRPPDLFAMHCEALHRQTSPSPGSLLIIPAGTPSRWEWHGPCDSSQIQLEPQLLTRVAAEALDLNPDRVELPPVHDLSHPQLRATVQALDAELRADSPGSRLLAESLGNVLAVQLLRQFVAPTKAGPSPDGVLARRKLHAVIEYIHEHLDA